MSTVIETYTFEDIVKDFDPDFCHLYLESGVAMCGKIGPTHEAMRITKPDLADGCCPACRRVVCLECMQIVGWL